MDVVQGPDDLRATQPGRTKLQQQVREVDRGEPDATVATDAPLGPVDVNHVPPLPYQRADREWLYLDISGRPDGFVQQGQIRIAPRMTPQVRGKDLQRPPEASHTETCPQAEGSAEAASPSAFSRRSM